MKKRLVQSGNEHVRVASTMQFRADNSFEHAERRAPTNQPMLATHCSLLVVVLHVPHINVFINV
jgi:hypothetical protein